MRKLFLLISLFLITGVFLQAQTVDVTFQVDMSVKIATGYFNPGSDVVTCPGGFNNWLNEPPPNTEKVMIVFIQSLLQWHQTQHTNINLILD
jgi:hypothetical protein